MKKQFIKIEVELVDRNKSYTIPFRNNPSSMSEKDKEEEIKEKVSYIANSLDNTFKDCHGMIRSIPHDKIIDVAGVIVELEV